MTLPELNNKFDKVIDDMQSTPMGNIMVQIGSDALVTIRDRIINTGVDAEGQKYAPYSTRSMLSGCKNMLGSSCEKLIGSKPKRKEQKWVTIQRGGKNVHLFEIPGGYKQFREISGRQTGFVDFSFSGQMWRNIKVVSNNSEHNQGIARIAATTPLANDILAGNTSRRTDILKLSRSEISELSMRFNIGIVQIFHNNGL